MNKQNRPALIVFGKRPRKQPRAAWFAVADSAVARWVAQQHGLSVLKATATVMNQLGNPIAEWQLANEGEPIIPTVRLDTFDQLRALAEQASEHGQDGTVPPGDAERPTSTAVTTQQREAAKALWNAMEIGSLVLAQEDDPEHGWWEAIVLAIHQNVCTLCWRDHPGDGLVKRELHQLAILHPQA